MWPIHQVCIWIKLIVVLAPFKKIRNIFACCMREGNFLVAPSILNISKSITRILNRVLVFGCSTKICLTSCMVFRFRCRGALHLFNVEKLYLLPLAAAAAGNGSLTFVNILVIRAQTLACCGTRPANGIGSGRIWTTELGLGVRWAST